MQVPQHTGYHARNACNALQEDIPNQVLFFRHGELLSCCYWVLCIHIHGLWVLISRHPIETPAQHLDGDQSNFIGHGLGFTVSDNDLVHLLFGVYWGVVSC